MSTTLLIYWKLKNNIQLRIIRKDGQKAKLQVICLKNHSYIYLWIHTMSHPFIRIWKQYRKKNLTRWVRPNFDNDDEDDWNPKKKKHLKSAITSGHIISYFDPWKIFSEMDWQVLYLIRLPHDHFYISMSKSINSVNHKVSFIFC
jgi:hypothetical protein